MNDVARPSDARVRTLETAANLFRRQGYHGTPVSQILDESGAPRGSLYFHFPGGKEQIAAEAVEIASTEMVTLIERARERSATAVEFIGRVTGGIARWLEQSDYVEGCPIATVTLELVPSVDEVAEAVRGAYRLWTELIRDGLIGFGLPADKAEGVALLSVTAIEGGLLLSRADRSTVALRQVREQLMAIAASSS
ncbi:MAG TPA: TetR/AcrR family transcriptional regulator [Acidimicrobiia bacterium]|nr:TetR/AcrR family transcriptional regulator [Acidimicrobiia bacterium]